MHDVQPHLRQAVSLAVQALPRLEALESLSTLEQNRALQALSAAEGWAVWRLGGFRLPDGSVLHKLGEGWQSLSAEEARALLHAESNEPLEVRLHYCYEGLDGREKRSSAEARFVYEQGRSGWRLTVEYEAFTDSPLYGLEAGSFAELGVELWNLTVDTPQPAQRWRLEEIASHLDWLELLTCTKPDKP